MQIKVILLNHWIVVTIAVFLNDSSTGRYLEYLELLCHYSSDECLLNINVEQLMKLNFNITKLLPPLYVVKTCLRVIQALG